MSREINLETASKEFMPRVEDELQNKERLQGTTEEYDQTGEAMQIPFMDQVNMKQVATTPEGFTAGDLTITPVGQRKVVFVPGEWNVKTVIGNSAKTLYNYDIFSGYVRQHANAIGRFKDYMKITAVTNGVYSAANRNQVAVDFGQNQGLNIDKIAEAKFMLEANAAGDGMVSLWVNATGMPDLMRDPRYASSFYSDKKAYMIPGQQAPISPLGIDVRTLSMVKTKDNQVNNLLPVEADGTQKAYLVWHDAVAVSYNRRPESWVANEKMSGQDRVSAISAAAAASQILYPEGIIEINFKPTDAKGAAFPNAGN